MKAIKSELLVNIYFLRWFYIAHQKGSCLKLDNMGEQVVEQDHWSRSAHGQYLLYFHWSNTYLHIMLSPISFSIKETETTNTLKIKLHQWNSIITFYVIITYTDTQEHWNGSLKNKNLQISLTKNAGLIKINCFFLVIVSFIYNFIWSLVM